MLAGVRPEGQHLRVVRLPQDDHEVPLTLQLGRLLLGRLDERAGGVHDLCVGSRELVLDLPRHSMRTEDHGTFSRFLGIGDNLHSPLLQIGDNARIVDERAQRADRARRLVGCPLCQFEGALHSPAEAGALGDPHMQGGQRVSAVEARRSRNAWLRRSRHQLRALRPRHVAPGQFERRSEGNGDPSKTKQTLPHDPFRTVNDHRDGHHPVSQGKQRNAGLYLAQLAASLPVPFGEHPHHGASRQRVESAFDRATVGLPPVHRERAQQVDERAPAA